MSKRLIEDKKEKIFSNVYREKIKILKLHQNIYVRVVKKEICVEFAVKMVGFGHAQIILIAQLLMMIIMEFLCYKKLKIR